MPSIIAGVLFSFLIQGNIAHGKLLDKILAVFNDEIITLSQVNRIKSTLPARNEVAGLIYRKKTYTHKALVEMAIKKSLIRTRLKEMKQIIEEDSVESYIKQNVEKRLGISRKQLINHLKSRGISFEEFFELYRQNLEYSNFHQLIIAPLVTITEQEVKNAFYKLNFDNKTISFRYTLVDFSLDKSLFKKGILKKFRKVLMNYQINNTLPNNFSKLETNVLGNIKEEDLNNDLKKLLKRAEEGSFSQPISINNRYHVFLIK
ncbi:MAG: hypothetical protein OXB84_00625, partial [Halobacteriovoraceae bacterium]|nr:hypothetical protein [Halobacteriovoraceae bacterium]